MFILLLMLWLMLLTYITFVLYAFAKARDFGFSISFKTAMKIPLVLLKIHLQLSIESYKKEKRLLKSLNVLFRAIYDYNSSLTFIYTIITYGIGEIQATGKSSILTEVSSRKRKRVNGYFRLGNGVGNFKNVLKSEGYKERFV